MDLKIKSVGIPTIYCEDSEGFSPSENHTFCKYKTSFLSEHLKNISFLSFFFQNSSQLVGLATKTKNL
ncbi:hypothetical protein LEP1GSC193_0452 [Leptospira alstonii serovar Pingchang str. 80-412]|uniref:Uncharacterized protein n=2 Tax=Leptospira alstonii TaxID=28452 RepID=M6CPS8_9LEPT|nr:hypothetical protein LEP1GSC194_1474 [Leptospira alstonii serovar Sichuan str. 79601]EQA79447.1 hypothetical protein LEP1GSC193_0452 [Leptospira alstonii serovar Pingchang str. 80-412]